VSMFANMVTCVEILLSLDICVKYAQCVKIWLFLKCVQFHEVLCSVSSEAKGDTPTECVSQILVKGYVPIECASHILVKGDARCGGASPFYLICGKKHTNYSP
jgi:hypothetical protein